MVNKTIPKSLGSIIMYNPLYTLNNQGFLLLNWISQGFRENPMNKNHQTIGNQKTKS